MTNDVEIRDIEPQQIMAIRFSCPTSESGAKFGEVLPAVFGHVVAQGA